MVMRVESFKRGIELSSERERNWVRVIEFFFFFC